MIEEAMRRQLSALLGQLNAICTAVADLTEAVTETFHRHPDAKILTNCPV